MALKFGVHLPLWLEGTTAPIPFARPAEILPIALRCEHLGYDSVWGNDHITTPRDVRGQGPEPPNVYEPLITLGYAAGWTTKLRLGTGVIVLPIRNVPLLAKQVATLDQLSRGRVILGVGTGADREEYEALFPAARRVHRGTMVDEGIKALRLLFTERRATFRGRYVKFQDVECFPKPVQTLLPIYVGGNHPEVRRRAGELADGWMPRRLTVEEIKKGADDVKRAADKAGRDAATIEIAPQLAVAIARTSDEAQQRFRDSQRSTDLDARERKRPGAGIEQRGLIGSPEEICERVRAYEKAGVTRFPAMLFVADTLAAMQEAIELFGRGVIPHFT